MGTGTDTVSRDMGSRGAVARLGLGVRVGLASVAGNRPVLKQGMVSKLEVIPITFT